MNSTRMLSNSKMLGRFALSSAIVLCVTAGAFAGIMQLQDYVVGASNQILFEHSVFF